MIPLVQPLNCNRGYPWVPSLFVCGFLFFVCLWGFFLFFVFLKRYAIMSPGLIKQNAKHGGWETPRI